MISIILIEPKTQGNLGAVARTMKNFGFNDLVLINPKCRIGIEAKKRAKNAVDLLKKIKIKKVGYLKQFDYLVGTSAIYGTDYNIPRIPVSVEDLAVRLNKIQNKKIGIVFGREDKGLTNEEVLMCDFIVNIPSSEKYKTLNLSHAVAIVLYEISKFKNKTKLKERFVPISKKEKEQILKMIDEILNKMDFATKEKRETQIKVWKRIMGKSMLTRREAYALMGFLKKVN